eukprot:5893606-Pleurochrysis_carterae.AAC.1
MAFDRRGSREDEEGTEEASRLRGVRDVWRTKEEASRLRVPHASTRTPADATACANTLVDVHTRVDGDAI